MINPALFSSDVETWRTPEWLVERIRAFRGSIGLDPATTFENPCGATTICVPPSIQLEPSQHDFDRVRYDGLAHTRRGFGLVYCNPPYGRGIGVWTSKARAEFAFKQPPKDELIMLLPARTDTGWWHDNVTTAKEVLFLRGRLRFVGAPNSAPFPSALAYWGTSRERFVRTFEYFGWIP